MSKRILVISDLHLADDHPILEGFGRRQQAAFEELLRATEPGGSLAPLDTPTPGDKGAQGEVELIINGDCFDLLAVQPYLADGISTPAIACEKLALIVPLHGAFFGALRQFLRTPGRHITFLPGNHDIDLVFEEAQEYIHHAIDAGEKAANISFCQTSFYRPAADVYIEHGHQYDFWNHARDAWDAVGYPREPRPARLTLPVGTQYFQRASYPISVRFPYFDHFDPSLDSMRQIALLCLLDPDIVIETAHRAMQMLSFSRTALESLAPGEERVPATLFEKAILDFAAFQQDMIAQDPAWQASEDGLRARTAGMAAEEDQQAQAIREFSALREMLQLPPVGAVRAMLVPTVYQMSESVAAGMHSALRSEPSLRYAIAGHTHMLRHDTLTGSGGEQVYLNTACWTKREALPAPEEITPELVEWLRDPGGKASPLRDITQFVFALVDATEERSTARLCEWIGGDEGYREYM